MTVSQSRLTSASGYFELGMYQAAYDELDDLPADAKASLEVLEFRVEILHKMNAWDLSREVSRFLRSTSPENSQYVIWEAYAARRISGIEAAEKVLLDAMDDHKGEPIIHYNLACYAAQLGKITEAGAHLAKAIEIDPSVRLMALDDNDLEPLWDNIGELSLKE